MRRIGSIVILMVWAHTGFSQVNCGFELIFMAPETFINDSPSGAFECENVSLFNDYNEQYSFWSGWALSNITDNTTAGFGNQYASRAGGGDDSEIYALTYAFSGSVLKFDVRSTVQSVSISNSAYAYYSMLEGDAFAKKFGGETGNDPDYFELKIQKFLDGILSTEEVTLKLADYTFADNSQDYILDAWNEIDLQALGLADSLFFTLSSTDVGDFGMNTPAYFCIDNIFSTPQPIGLEELNEDVIKMYPNPVKDIFTVDSKEQLNLQIYTAKGRKVLAQILQVGSNMISIEQLKPGVYICEFRSSFGLKRERIVIL